MPRSWNQRKELCIEEESESERGSQYQREIFRDDEGFVSKRGSAYQGAESALKKNWYRKRRSESKRGTQY
jgi:hypothetical protein